MAIIYYAANKITGKSYVGQCVHDLQYKQSTYEALSKTRTEAIFKAIREYGFDAFIWGVLAEGNFTQAELDQLEDDWMQKLNSLAPNGYNQRTGGRHGKYSPALREQRWNEWAARSGKYYEVEHCGLALECVRA